MGKRIWMYTKCMPQMTDSNHASSQTAISRGAALLLDANRKGVELVPLPTVSQCPIFSMTDDRLLKVMQNKRNLDEHLSQSPIEGLALLAKSYRRILAEQRYFTEDLEVLISTYSSLAEVFKRSNQTAQLEKLRKEVEMMLNPDSHDWTAMHLAAIHNSPHILDFLLDTGSLINEPWEEENSPFHLYTPLHSAIFGENIPAISWFLEKQANIAMTTAKGQTALHLACFQGKGSDPAVVLEMVKTLIEAACRANILNFEDKDGMTALEVARMFELEDTVRLLKDKGATENSLLEV